MRICCGQYRRCARVGGYRCRHTSHQPTACCRGYLPQNRSDPHRPSVQQHRRPRRLHRIVAQRRPTAGRGLRPSARRALARKPGRHIWDHRMLQHAAVQAADRWRRRRCHNGRSHAVQPSRTTAIRRSPLCRQSQTRPARTSRSRRGTRPQRLSIRAASCGAARQTDTPSERKRPAITTGELSL